jgi:hypothetical protein
VDERAELIASAERLADELRGFADRLRAWQEPEPVQESSPEPSPEPEPEPLAEPAGPDDAGARIVALNMALNGASRQETRSYLDGNYDLEDPESLLDAVYSKVKPGG